MKERVGYSGFLSLVWLLWKAHREAKRLRMQVRLDITLPAGEVIVYKDRPA